MSKNKTRLIFGIVLGIIEVLTGLVYILFPDFLIRNNWNFGLGIKGLLIVGIIVVSLSIVSFFLNSLSKLYRKLLSKYKKIVTALYILNWIITIFLLIALINTTGAIVQSIV